MSYNMNDCRNFLLVVRLATLNLAQFFIFVGPSNHMILFTKIELTNITSYNTKIKANSQNNNQDDNSRSGN